MTANYPRREQRKFLKDFIDRRIEEIQQNIKVNEITMENKPESIKELTRVNRLLKQSLETNKEMAGSLM